MACSGLEIFIYTSLFTQSVATKKIIISNNELITSLFVVSHLIVGVKVLFVNVCCAACWNYPDFLLGGGHTSTVEHRIENAD